MQDFRYKLLAISCEPRALQVLIEINSASIMKFQQTYSV